MDFGKVPLQELPDIDFNLPPDPAFTLETLKQNHAKKKLKVYVGCAKWGRKEWVGQIFPAKTKEKDFLTAYANQFDCVELNATFYQVYGEEILGKWKAQTAANPDFLFCPKFSQTISHIKRLKDASEVTTAYYKGIMAFGEKLGPVFLQLSDSFGPKNFTVLQEYLEQLPKDVPVYVELRHKEWFSEPENSQKVFELFRKLNIGSIITDASGRRDVVHMNLSTPSAFIRFVGNNLHSTDYDRADEWIARIKIWQGLGLESLYFFMHNTEEANSPKMADYFIERINKALGLEVRRPRFLGGQGELF